MVILDNITEGKLEKLKDKLDEKLKSRTIVFERLSELNENVGDEQAICVFGLTKGFFDIDAFEFLRNQTMFSNVSIIIAASKNRMGNLANAQSAVAWANELVKIRRKNYKVIAEVDIEDDDYIFELVKAQISPKKNTNKNKVIIYTDGSCSGNPGAGGWGAILMADGKHKEISGGEADTTNNRMELTAVIKALEHLKKPCSVELYSDSAYVVNAFEQNWIKQWKKKNWKNSERVLVKNIDLWQKLDSLTQLHKVHFNKVKGHADNEFNNRCDELAVLETNKLIEKL